MISEFMHRSAVFCLITAFVAGLSQPAVLNRGRFSHPRGTFISLEGEALAAEAIFTGDFDAHYSLAKPGVRVRRWGKAPPRLQLARGFLTLLGWVALHTLSAGAQDQWSIGLVGGASSPHIMTDTPGRLILAPLFRYSHTLKQGPHVKMDYVAEWMPIVSMTEPHEEGFYYFNNGSGRFVSQGPATILGTSASPLGFRWTFAPRSRLSLYTTAGVGYLWTTKNIPYQFPEDAKFNFTFQGGAGLRFKLRHGPEAFAEYRWWHTSDAGRTEDNSGVDSNQIGVGITIPAHVHFIPRLGHSLLLHHHGKLYLFRSA